MKSSIAARRSFYGTASLVGSAALAIASCTGEVDKISGGAGSSGASTQPKPGAGGSSTSGSGGASGAAGGGGTNSGSGGAMSNGGNTATGGSGGDSGGASGGTAGSSGATCEAGQYIICEDFESTDVGAIPQGWTQHGDASGVADDAAKHGSRSLKLGAIPVWERRIYHDASALGSAHWGRIFYKVKAPVPDAFVHSTLVALHGTGPAMQPGEYRTVDTVKHAKDTANVGSRHQFLYNVQRDGAGEFATGTSYDWSFDEQWHCAEWYIDGTNQRFQFYFDGSEEIAFEDGFQTDQGFVDADIPSSFSEVRIGWINYQTSPPGFTAWIDDIALDDERIGCD